MLAFDWLAVGAVGAVVGLTILRMGLPILALLLAGEVFQRAASQQAA